MAPLFQPSAEPDASFIITVLFFCHSFHFGSVWRNGDDGKIYYSPLNVDDYYIGVRLGWVDVQQ
jgi:hypothetical protein